MDAAAAGPAAPRGWRRYASLLFLLGLGAATALTALVPYGCSFRLLTGAPCPGCGMTRACAALARGDLLASLRLHPLGIPLVVAAAGAILLALREAATGRPVLRDLAERKGAALLAAGIALLAGVWLVRVVIHPAWSPDPIRPGSLAAEMLE